MRYLPHRLGLMLVMVTVFALQEIDAYAQRCSGVPGPPQEREINLGEYLDDVIKKNIQEQGRNSPYRGFTRDELTRLREGTLPATISRSTSKKTQIENLLNHQIEEEIKSLQTAIRNFNESCASCPQRFRPCSDCPTAYSRNLEQGNSAWTRASSNFDEDLSHIRTSLGDNPCGTFTFSFSSPPACTPDRVGDFLYRIEQLRNRVQTLRDARNSLHASGTLPVSPRPTTSAPHSQSSTHVPRTQASSTDATILREQQAPPPQTQTAPGGQFRFGPGTTDEL